MKRLLIILLCLPLIFACKREEPFVEGEEIVLNMSVNTDDIYSIATRAMGDSKLDTLPLWLVVFDGEGYLVEWAKAYYFSQTTDTNGEVTTSFKARLHATSEERNIHFLLNYVDNDSVLSFNYGHENNIIGGLTVEYARDVYWQRVNLPEGINGNTDNTSTGKKYLTKVPLVRNFSRITVSETADNFELLGFYVLNVPKYGTVVPFHDGEFVKYYTPEDANFDGKTPFKTKSYQQLDVNEGYRGTIPNVDDERIQTVSDFKEADLTPPDSSYYLYENRYISGDKDRTVSVLLKGNYSGTDYWYRVDLVKQNPTTGVLEYFDILRNFSYNINITKATVGKAIAKDAIEHAAGNNVLSSLDIAHLTEISDGTALLEVNHTDTVLISRDTVYVRYKFTDDGNGEIGNKDIANTSNNCGYYLTHTGAGNIPINVSFDSIDEETGEWKDWRKITVTVAEDALTEREEVDLTLFAKTSAGTVLSRTVSYTLLPQQKMLVECPTKVPEVVGSEVNVSILIPDGLPEAMFPLDFAIEAQGTDSSGNEKNYLAQHISPHKNEVMTVRTAGSIVDNDALRGKKSFQYIVTFSYEDYLAATTTTRQLNGVNVEMRVFIKKFVTNTETSASRVYAYNKYFDLGSDNFINDTIVDFKVSFIDDETATYGVGRTIKLNITVGEAGKYLIESNTLQSPTRAVLKELDMTTTQPQTIDLVTSTFANRGKVLVTCKATGVMKEIFAVERNKLNAQAVSKYNGEELTENPQLNVSESEDDALSGDGLASVTVTALKNRTTITVPDIENEDDILYFSYIKGKKLYIASATAGDLNDGTALEFEEREFIQANITDLSLLGDKYYGEGRVVTFKFTTDRVGTYTITQTEGTKTATYRRTVTEVGEQTVTLKTLTWGDKLNVTVKGMNASKSVVGATRNTIKFGKLTLRRNNNDVNSNNITITYDNKTVKTGVKSSELTTGGYELNLPGVREEDLDNQITFSYNTRSARATISDIMKEEITLNF